MDGQIMDMYTESIRILMADDDADDRLMMKEAMEEFRFGNSIDFVEDGQELMDYLKREGDYTDMADKPLPGLILLDLNMPRKDGRQALEEIKNDRNLRMIPVVILTTSKAEEDVLRSYNLGSNSYISKPVDFKKLTEVVRTITDYWLHIVRLPG